MPEKKAECVALGLLREWLMRLSVLLVPVGMLTVLFACGGSTSTVGTSNPDGGGEGCLDKCSVPHVPTKHRPAAAACSTDRPTTEPSNTSGGGGSNCKQNSDCKDGRDGRCRLGRAGAFCTYNECATDNECQANGGGVCECGDPNFCTRSGDCHVDSDCGASGYCSPSLGDCGEYGGIIGYYCHRAVDECVDDADCTADGAFGYCAFDPNGAKWKCSQTQCAG